MVMKIGVFDSGIGGEAVASELRVAFPSADLLVVNDRKNVPYGSKTPEQVVEFTTRAIDPLLRTGCDVIVIACNTATTLALPHLRKTYPDQKFIGIEPMLKPASLMTKTGVVCVCATPATLASERYGSLKNTYTTNLKVIEPDCSSWASLIEQNSLSTQQIEQTIGLALEADADVIVLGCTHYHWIKHLVQTIARGKAAVLEPSEAIANRVRSLLS